MTALLPVFKLKNLLSQLNDLEFDAVFTKFLEQFGRQYVVQLMCSPMLLSLLRTEHQDSIDSLTSIVATLLKECSETTTEPSVSVTKRITDLPTSLIGEIGSFLPHESYIKFAQTNRKVFVDCHSPNKLSGLLLVKQTDYSPISLQNYPNLRYLHFRLPHVGSFRSGIAEHCRRLKTLCILIDGADGAVTDDVAAENNFLQFMITNPSGFNNVTTLIIDKEHKRGDAIQSTLLMRVLSFFPNVTHLKLSEIGFSSASLLQRLPPICPSIHQLFSSSVPHEAALLQTSSANLHTLSLFQAEDHTLNLSLSDWSKLRRLCLISPTRNLMDQFLENAKELKEICFVPNVGGASDQPLTAKEVGIVTKQLFTDYPSLEFIYVSTHGYFERICHSIHQGLYHTRKMKRELLEIGLHLDCSEIDDLADFMCSISKLIIALSGSQTKQWMVTLKRHQQYDLDPMTTALRELISSYPRLDIKLLQQSQSTLVVGNAGCKVLPHRHWWNDGQNTSFY